MAAAICAAAYVLLLVWIAAWTLYVHPSDRGIFNRTWLLGDDGGNYVSVITRLSDAAPIVDTYWYRYASESLTERDLFLEWGYYAGRLKTIFQPQLVQLSPYFVGVGAAGSALGSYAEAFYLSMLALPGLVALKYVFLWFVTGRKRGVLLLPIALLLDVGHAGHVNSWFTAEAYAWHVFSAGLVALLAGRLIWLGWGLIALGVATHVVLAPVALALAAARVAAAARQPILHALFAWVRRLYLPAALTLIVFAIVIAGLAYGTAVLLARPGHGDPYGLLDVYAALFTGTLRYLDPVVVVPLVVVERLRRDPRATSPSAEALPLATLALLAAVPAYAAVTAFVSPLLASDSQRLYPYVVTLLVLEGALRLAALAPDRDFFRNHAVRSELGLLVVAVPLAIGASVLIGSLPLRPPSVIGEGAFPSLQVTPCVHYVADRPQRVYGYFIRRDYLRAPLVLDLRGGRYSAGDAVSAACRGGLP